MGAMTSKINGVNISSVKKIHGVLDTPTKIWSIHGMLHASVADNMVAWWQCNETTGTSMADSKDSYTGTIHNTNADTIAISGKVRGALDFPGNSSKYASVAYSANLNTSAFSVALWARCDGGAGANMAAISNRDIVSGNSRGWIVYRASSNKWEFWLGNGTGSWEKVVGPTYTADTWTHVCVTFDGTSMYLYVDATQYGPTTPSAFVANGARELRIAGGNNDLSVGVLFNGPVDGIRIYNRALTVTEVGKLAGTLT